MAAEPIDEPIRLKAVWDDVRRVYTMKHRGHEMSVPCPIFSAEEMCAMFHEFVNRVNEKLGDFN